MTHRHPLDQEDPIPWHTRINGNTYRLTEHGRLQKEDEWLQRDYRRPMTPGTGKRSSNESSDTNSTH